MLAEGFLGLEGKLLLLKLRGLSPVSRLSGRGWRVFQPPKRRCNTIEPDSLPAVIRINLPPTGWQNPQWSYSSPLLQAGHPRFRDPVLRPFLRDRIWRFSILRGSSLSSSTRCSGIACAISGNFAIQEKVRELGMSN